MPSNYHPTEGVRLLLERIDQEGAMPSYKGSVFTPTERFDYTVTLDDQFVVTLKPLGSAPEDETKKIKKLADSIARKAQRSQGGLPDRILRWRGPGRG